MSNEPTDQTDQNDSETQPVEATVWLDHSDPDPTARHDVEDDEPKRQWPFGYLLLWVLTVVSLLINVVLLRQVILARQAAQIAVGQVLGVLEDLQGASLSYDVVVDQTLQIETALPIDETIPVVIDQDLPIDTTVRANVNAGILGQIPLTVPIVATVPVYIEQDIRIDQPFDITMAVPVNFTVPIEVSVANTPLAGTLDDVIVRLEELQNGLGKPLIPVPGAERD